MVCWCAGAGQAGRAKAEADAVASAPAASTSGRLPSSAKDSSSATPAVIPLSSGRGLAIRYLQVLIDSSARTVSGGASSAGGIGDGGDASGRDGATAVPSALHDELAYLLMEGLLVSRIRRSRRSYFSPAGTFCRNSASFSCNMKLVVFHMGRWSLACLVSLGGAR